MSWHICAAASSSVSVKKPKPLGLLVYLSLHAQMVSRPVLCDSLSPCYPFNRALQQHKIECHKGMACIKQVFCNILV